MLTITSYLQPAGQCRFQAIKIHASRTFLLWLGLIFFLQHVPSSLVFRDDGLCDLNFESIDKSSIFCKNKMILSR